jgi:muramidase (phage lysozyme)
VQFSQIYATAIQLIDAWIERKEQMDARYKAMLDAIAWSEGTSTHPLTRNDGYDVIVNGVAGKEVFSDYSDHPFAAGRVPVVVSRVPLLRSTAAGRYQILKGTWFAYKAKLALTDFSPPSQDAVALQLIRERGALELLDTGRIGEAMTRCSNLWASLPGNNYGQGGHSLEALTEKYGGFLTAVQPQPEAA